MKPRSIVNLHNGFLLAAVLVGFLVVDGRTVGYGLPMILAAASATIVLIRATTSLAVAHFFAACCWLGCATAFGIYYFNDSLSNLLRLKSVSAGVSVAIIIACGYIIPVVLILLYKFVAAKAPSVEDMRFEDAINKEDSEWSRTYYLVVGRTLLAISIVLICIFVVLQVMGSRS